MIYALDPGVPLLVIFVVGVVGGVGWLYRRHFVRLWFWLLGPQPLPPLDIEQSEDPLITNIRLLANRVTLAESVITRLRRVVTVLAVMVVAGVVMTVVVGVLYRDSRSQYDDIVASRTESRAATCRSDNEKANQINAGNEAKAAILASQKEIQLEIDALVDPIRKQPSSGDPARDKALADYLASFDAHKASVDAAQSTAADKIAAAHVPLRDCSPEAIADFYRSK